VAGRPEIGDLRLGRPFFSLRRRSPSLEAGLGLWQQPRSMEGLSMGKFWRDVCTGHYFEKPISKIDFFYFGKLENSSIFFSKAALIFLARHAWRRGITTKPTKKGDSCKLMEFYLSSLIAKSPSVLVLSNLRSFGY
jgi:hypothetical protein